MFAKWFGSLIVALALIAGANQSLAVEPAPGGDDDAVSQISKPPRPCCRPGQECCKGNWQQCCRR